MGELVRYNEAHKIALLDSRLAAKVLGVEHESIQTIVRKYKADFEEFGELRLEIGASETGQKTIATLFNEEQASLLITYTQNTEQARQAKMRIIKEFKLMRDIIDRLKDSVLAKFSKDFQAFLSSYYEQINWAFDHVYSLSDGMMNLERYSALEARLRKIESTFEEPQLLEGADAGGS